MKLHPFHFVVLKTLIKTIKIIKNESCFSVPLFQPIKAFLRFTNYQASSVVQKLYQSRKTFNEDKKELIWMFLTKQRQMSQRKTSMLCFTHSLAPPPLSQIDTWLAFAVLSGLLYCFQCQELVNTPVDVCQNEPIGSVGFRMHSGLNNNCRFCDFTRFTIGSS